MTPTGTQPVAARTSRRSWRSARRWTAFAQSRPDRSAAIAVVWRPWARDDARPLDPSLVAVLPFRVAGADPSRAIPAAGDAGPAAGQADRRRRAALRRHTLGAGRGARCRRRGRCRSFRRWRRSPVARTIGAGRVLQGSIVGPADHLVVAARAGDLPGGRTLAQASVTGPKDSLFVLVDRLTAQVLALGAGASTASSAPSRPPVSTRCAPTSTASPPSAAAPSRSRPRARARRAARFHFCARPLGADRGGRLAPAPRTCGG